MIIHVLSEDGRYSTEVRDDLPDEFDKALVEMGFNPSPHPLIGDSQSFDAVVVEFFRSVREDNESYGILALQIGQLYDVVEVRSFGAFAKALTDLLPAYEKARIALNRLQ